MSKRNGRSDHNGRKLEHYVPAFLSALEEYHPLPVEEPVSLAELLAEYDPRVLKQWLADQHTTERPMDVPEAKK